MNKSRQYSELVGRNKTFKNVLMRCISGIFSILSAFKKSFQNFKFYLFWMDSFMILQISLKFI